MAHGRTIWRRSLTIGLALLFAIALSAQAEPRTKKRDYLPQDILETVNVEAGTVEMGGHTFRVGDRTSVMDERGNPILLRELSALGSGRMVEYKVRGSKKRKRSGERELRSIKILEGVFEYQRLR